MSVNTTTIELRDLLEHAAMNATGSRQEVDRFVLILKNEWVTDIDSLRRMDGDALDEILPLLLSRELQRLISHNGYSKPRWEKSRRSGSFDGPSNTTPSPSSLSQSRHVLPSHMIVNDDTILQKSSRQQSSAVLQSRMFSSPRLGQLTKITRSVVKDTNTGVQYISGAIKEMIRDPFHKNDTITTTLPPRMIRIGDDEESSSASSSKDGQHPLLYKRQYKKKNDNIDEVALCKMFDLFDNFCSYSPTIDNDEQTNDLASYGISTRGGEGIDDDELQHMSNEHPFALDGTGRANHLIADESRKANFVDNGRRRFPTREALEDAIQEYQTLIKEEKTELEVITKRSNVPSSVVSKKKELIATAEDELRTLYPLRLILHTVGDLTEMIVMLQWHREQAMRDFDMDKANDIQKEIDQTREQIDNEERYLMKERMLTAKCVACGDKFVPTSTRIRQRLTGVNEMKGESHCESCRKVFGQN